MISRSFSFLSYVLNRGLLWLRYSDSVTPVKEMEERRHRSLWTVFIVFLRLGCTSFGGPVAHIGYFRHEFVERRRWCSEGQYGELLAIAHSLPGPSSSQVGFGIGLLQAGWAGGIAAWLGFTLPSAVLMIAFAFGHELWAGPRALLVFHGLQLVAVAVVAQAVVKMQQTLALGITRILLALASAAFVLFVPWPVASLVVIAITAVFGMLLFRNVSPGETDDFALGFPRRIGVGAAISFLILLIASFVLATSSHFPLAMVAAFYRSGALVFGGGHVVLPLLESSLVARGWVTQQAFLAGYGAAQAVPGPLFTFAAYLGAVTGLGQAGGVLRVLYALASLIALFLPGLLAMTAVIPFWSKVRGNVRLRGALMGVGAGVVGILAAALVDPLLRTAVHSVADGIIASAAFLLLFLQRVQAWMIVVGVVLAVLLVR
jgi:chromate transporter